MLVLLAGIVAYLFSSPLYLGQLDEVSSRFVGGCR